MQTFDKTVWYTIAAKVSGKVIEAESASVENGAALCLAAATGADQQLWSIEHITDKYYKIINKHSGKAMDLMFCGTEAGTNLQQWDYLEGETQKWFFEDKADGAVCIKSALSERCVDVTGMNADAEGARLQIWDDVNGENQCWMIQAQTAPVAEEAPAAEEAKAEEAAPKKRRKRRTKAEIEADKAAKAAAKAEREAAKAAKEAAKAAAAPKKRTRRTKAEIEAAKAAGTEPKKRASRAKKA